MIPIVSLISIDEIVVWRICVMRRKPGWLSLLMLVPLGSLIIPGVLTFAD